MSLHTLTEPAGESAARPPDAPSRCRARALLQSALLVSLPIPAQSWLIERLEALASDDSQRTLDLAFGLAPRRLGKQLLELSPTGMAELTRQIPDWPVSRLRCDEAARMVMLARMVDAEEQANRITDLLRHADMNEQLAIYRGLPLYAASATLNDRLADGLRSNMNEVFEAIAHDNPFAAWHLDTHRFNHMVLKALFIGSELAPIVGLARRANPELARMLLETARERHAAGRPISPEVWPIAQPFMSAAERNEFKGVMPQ